MQQNVLMKICIKRLLVLNSMKTLASKGHGNLFKYIIFFLKNRGLDGFTFDVSKFSGKI